MTHNIPFLSDDCVNCEIGACGIALNVSRQRITNEQWNALLQKGRDCDLIGAQRRMVEGEVVNQTENRQALHTSLRSQDSEAPHYADVQATLNRMYAFAEAVRSGQWRGARGKRITDVVNVGIGGSEMGPHAVYHALQGVKQPIRLHFLSAVDGTLVDRTLGALDPDSTLVIVSSKSFSTRETMVNAAAVDEWLGAAGLDAAQDRAKHVILVTAKPDAYREMNVPESNQFPLWDWVGGRFSVWGAIGLPDVIALGPDVFQELLLGAHEMDCHMLNAPIEKNLPAILALLSTWCSSQWQMQYHCLLPYDERLRHLVPWLQQLEMESLGKTYTPTGERLEGMTGQGVWGGHGNEAQHSFYQWLREGTGRTSIDLLWCDNPGHNYHHHHRVLVANAQAQAKALVTREMSSDASFFNAVTTIRLDELTPRRLGALMAMYEHKTTMLAHLFGINAFDQPGVELGKRLSHQVESQF